MPAEPCGNGQLDPGEECDPPGALQCPDPSSPAGAFVACEADCMCPEPTPGPTTTTTTSTTTPSTTSTTTTTISSTTTTTVPLDHFFCYRSGGGHTFTATLSDQFDTGSYRAFHKVVRLFCAPGSKNGEGTGDPLTHLTAYRLKGPHAPQTRVRVTNQFGSFLYDTKRTYTLMIPTAKSLPPAPPPPPPDPQAHNVNHFRCVTVEPSRGTPRFIKRTVTIDDQFGTHQVTVKAPRTLCVPTSKDGGGIKNPDDHLLCYHVTSLPRVRPRGVHTSNEVGVEDRRLAGGVALCVPSLKRLE
jgi:hypothetical protein